MQSNTSQINALLSGMTRESRTGFMTAPESVRDTVKRTLEFRSALSGPDVIRSTDLPEDPSRINSQMTWGGNCGRSPFVLGALGGLVLMTLLHVFGPDQASGQDSGPEKHDVLHLGTLPATSPDVRISLWIRPASRFMRTLVAHAALWEAPRTGLGLTSAQRMRLRRILEETRSALITADTRDLLVRETFAAELVRSRISSIRLRILSIRIEEGDAREFARFLSALGAMQGVLTDSQRLVLGNGTRKPLPSARTALASAFSFAERVLFFREEAFRESRPEEDVPMARTIDRLARLAAKETVAKRALEDLMDQSWIDRSALERLEGRVLARSRRFWDGFIDSLDAPDSLDSPGIR